MRAVALAAAVLIVAACGGGEEPRAAGPPDTPPPEQASSDQAPPPAWVETAAGSFWLGYSTFCWDGLCADFAAPRCGDGGHVPDITVRAGERVRFHLGFDPREVSVTSFGGGEGTQDRLVAGREPVWSARAGAFAVFAVPKGRGGDASYAGCAVVSA